MVAFIDILGFREIIAHTIDAAGAEDTNATEKLINAMDFLGKTLEPPIEWVRIVEGYKGKTSIKFTPFSDSVVLSCAYSQPEDIFDMLITIFWAQVNLIAAGIMCRGGIDFGLALHDDKLILGPAMVQAYELESKHAIFPRILLSKKVYMTAQKSIGNNETMKRFGWKLESLIATDTDGHHFINYFNSEVGSMHGDVWESHREKLHSIVNKGLAIKNAKVWEKYYWVKEKLETYR